MRDYRSTGRYSARTGGVATWAWPLYWWRWFGLRWHYCTTLAKACRVPSSVGLGPASILPLLALLIVHLRRPTEVETARTLDALLDDRQRVVTAVELLGEPARVGDLLRWTSAP